MSTTRFERGARFIALVASVVCVARQASAQAEGDEAARALFEEGRRLIREGDYGSGCPKIEAAAKVHASPGVLLNLGDCYERANRTASAWEKFVEAEALSALAGRPDMQAEAERRKEEIDPRLSRLVVHVAEAGPGVLIERDGVAIDRAAWERPTVVDPGEHIVSAIASGQIAWSATIAVTEPGVIVVDVPKLSSETQRTAPVVRERPAGVGWSFPRVMGATLTGVGAIAMGAGGALALGARSKETLAEQERGSPRVDDSLSAVREGNLATGLVLGGAVLAVAGIVLWLTAPKGPPHGSASGEPLMLGGRF